MTVFNTEIGYLELTYLEENYLAGYGISSLGVQLFGETGNQAAVGTELIGFKSQGLGVELFAKTDSSQALGVQLIESNIGHRSCEEDQGYLDQNYLETRYLIGYMCAGLSVELDVQVLTSLGVELNVINYNTNRLRILCDIESRGDDSSNWTANSTLASSTDSFNINNVNTDIVEQVWRSNNLKVGLLLDCDAGVGTNIFMNTFVMVNHNLTTSAIVTLLGDDDPAFGSPGTTISFNMTENRFVYIAPDSPLSGFRYWRLTIDDNTNPNAYLQIGVIGFGAAEILNQNCYTDLIMQKSIDHKDTVFTEGFTNVMNERSLTEALTLNFRHIIYDSQDWNTLQRVFFSAKTTLKCFWIPDPQIPLRFLKFSKLKEIPPERHNYKGIDADYVDLNVNLDESL